jgi:tRNA nucleotidyltransferase/poly(A) polymerase
MIYPRKIVSKYLYKSAGISEKEVERFMKDFLPGTPFSNKTHAVGGFPRDEYLSLIKNDPSIEAKDLDIVVDMPDGAEKLTKYIYEQLVNEYIEPPISTPRQMGKDYPIWQITFKGDVTWNGKEYKTHGAVVEFADPMKETYPDPNSRQRKVEPATLEEDLKRRDLSINQLMKNLTTGEFEDLTGRSKHDIEQGILRGHPDINLDEIFSADPLRMIRILRFQAKYDWQIPMSVIKSIRKNADRIMIVSPERIMTELIKVMEMGKLWKAIKLMSITGLLHYILPEVEALKNTKQNAKYHGEGNSFKHTLLVLQNAPPGIEPQISALLHDVGKAESTQIIENEIHHIGHEETGAFIAETILRRLKFPNETVSKVTKMVRNHMRPHSLSEGGTKALRKFIREIGDDIIDDILALARADELGKLPPANNIPDLINRIKEIQKSPTKIQKEPILTGNEIMTLLGIGQGPEVGRAKKLLLEIEDEYAEKGKILSKEEASKNLLFRFKK